MSLTNCRVLGVLPAAQSNGIGTDMMKPVLKMADEDNLPIYLDTPNERSLRYVESPSALRANIDCACSQTRWASHV